MRKNNSLILNRVRESLPSFEESAQCASKLKAAVFDGVTATDMKTIMQGLVDKAKSGDLAATKVLLDFVSKSAPTPQLSIGARMNVAGQPALNGDARQVNGDRGLQAKAARILGTSGPASTEDLAAELDQPVESLRHALAVGADIGWFDLVGVAGETKWRLTETGRREAIG